MRDLKGRFLRWFSAVAAPLVLASALVGTGGTASANYDAIQLTVDDTYAYYVGISGWNQYGNWYTRKFYTPNPVNALPGYWWCDSQCPLTTGANGTHTWGNVCPGYGSTIEAWFNAANSWMKNQGDCPQHNGTSYYKITGP